MIQKPGRTLKSFVVGLFCSKIQVLVQKEMPQRSSRRRANSLFFSETAGGADTTLGPSQQADSLLCDAPRLGRHARYDGNAVFRDIIGSPVVCERKKKSERFLISSFFYSRF